MKMIVAMSENGSIGNNNKLMWKLKDDMLFFKEKTINNIVIMGHNTFKSLNKPLKDRLNIVLTKQDLKSTNNTIYLKSKEEAINYISNLDKNSIYYNKDVYVIGGEQIYNLFINDIKDLYLTKVDCNLEGSSKINYKDFIGNKVLKEKIYYRKNQDNQYSFTILVYESE